MQQRAAQFVPVADEVGRLQRGDDAECELFRSFCEKGHYAGRTQPSATRQGIYAIAPSGAFLASCNTRDAAVVARMLDEALARWQELPDAERYADATLLERLRAVRRPEDRAPDGGLVLAVTSRDLPRATPPPSGWMATAWNRDFAWFDRDQARALLPEQIAAGVEHEVPAALIERLVRFHLVDNVRGQTPAHRKEDVREAQLTVRVEAVADGRAELRLRGRSLVERGGDWPVEGFADQQAPAKQELGLRTELSGRATFDIDAGRFVAFELIAVGTRWGGTQFNGRAGDLAPTAIGFVFALDDTPDRVALAAIWSYQK